MPASSHVLDPVRVTFDDDNAVADAEECPIDDIQTVPDSGYTGYRGHGHARPAQVRGARHTPRRGPQRQPVALR